MEPVSPEERGTETHDGVEGSLRRIRLGDPGGDRLGCSLYEVHPGGQPWSYHYHVANEEAIYVLDGTATVEVDGGEYQLNPGEYLPFPAGPAGAHTIRNETEDPLRYLVMSTNDRPDVTVLPRRGVFGVRLESEDEPPEASISGFYPIDATLTE